MTTTTATTPELIHLDPTAIEIEENVRLDPRLDRDFLASIEEHGVLIPVLAVRIEGQDKPVVREGQRRIQAARQVGLSTSRSMCEPCRATTPPCAPSASSSRSSPMTTARP
jgi:hypothetical protein